MILFNSYFFLNVKHNLNCKHWARLGYLNNVKQYLEPGKPAGQSEEKRETMPEVSSRGAVWPIIDRLNFRALTGLLTYTRFQKHKGYPFTFPLCKTKIRQKSCL